MLRKTKQGQADTDQVKDEDTLICPVCGRPLYEDNLVDAQSVVEDNLYDMGGVRIVDCTVHLECDFTHQFDEEGFTLDEPHNLVAVVDAEFDETGECIRFAITEILTG